MAGVVSALVTDDDVEALRQQIDDLAFAFIAPLGADATMTIELTNSMNHVIA